MKYKKSLLSIGSITAVAAPLAAVISCGFDFGKNYTRSGGEVVLISDTGSVADKSFNQAAWDGTMQFGNSNNTKFSYIIPSELSPQIFHKAYKTAFDAGAKTLILPGFHHAFFADGGVGKTFGSKDDKTTPFVDETSAPTPGFEANYPDKYFVGIDIPDSDPTNKVYAQNFKTSQSGFLAAVYAGVYMNKYNKVEGDELKFSGYGGMNIASVTPFLDGYLQGAKWFNGHIDPSHSTWKPMKPVFADGNAPSSKDFTNSFAPGDATALSNTYLDKGAQIIVSVAGPQTADTIGAIKEAGRVGKAYVIGPDTDQSLAYDPNVVLGSMMKGITASTVGALDAIKTKEAGTALTPAQEKFTDDHTFIYNDNPSTTNLKASEMLVGFQPSRIDVNGKAKEVIITPEYQAAITYVKGDGIGVKTDGTGKPINIFDAGNNNRGFGATPGPDYKSSIDVAAENFIPGTRVDYNAHSELVTPGAPKTFYVVKDDRVKADTDKQTAAANAAIAELDKSIDAMLAQGIKTVKIGNNTVSVNKTDKAYTDAVDAIKAKFDVPITRIYVWDGSKFTTEIKDAFAGGTYGSW